MTKKSLVKLTNDKKIFSQICERFFHQKHKKNIKFVNMTNLNMQDTTHLANLTKVQHAYWRVHLVGFRCAWPNTHCHLQIQSRL